VVTRERFEQGMTPSQYVDQMTLNRDRLVSALQSIALSREEADLLARYPGIRRILVITEDWCGAAIASLPFVIKLIEGAPRIEMRIFLRDQNPDLMDQFLKDGRYRAIPVYVFLDEDMNELARFIERRPAWRRPTMRSSAQSRSANVRRTFFYHDQTNRRFTSMRA